MAYTLFENQLVNDGNWLSSYDTTWKAYFFQASSSHTVREIQLYMTRTGSPGTVTVCLYPNEGTGNYKPVIGGGTLTTGTTNGDTLPTSGGEWRAFTTTSYTLTSGTWYSIVVKATNGDSSNRVDWWGTNDNVLPDQWRHTTSDSGVNWYAGQFDCTYKIYGTSVIITTLAPTLVEDGMANLRLELEDKGGLVIYPVGWYCDENAAPSTEYTLDLWHAGGVDLPLGIYSKYVKTLPTGHATLYVQAWCDDSNSNRYTGEILSFTIPSEPEYSEFPDIFFPEYPEDFDWDFDWSYPDYPPWSWDFPEIPPWVYWDFPDLPPLPPWFLPDLPDWEIPDYPPMSFVGDYYYKKPYTRKDLEELRQKCINYEKNYTDFCLTINHNTLLAKNFLQEVYNNGVLAGENEMFANLHPSQQLTPLYLDPLGLNDFKDIINRFINNSTSNNMGLNHNFGLFTEWLNDYNYTSDGYKASHIDTRHKTITDDDPEVDYMKKKVDSLRKSVSSSSRKIGHNFNLIKEIIQ